MSIKLNRHNGIEWDKGGRWVDGNEADSLLKTISNSLYASNNYIINLQAQLADRDKRLGKMVTDKNNIGIQLHNCRLDNAEKDKMLAAVRKAWKEIWDVVNYHKTTSAEKTAMEEIDAILFSTPGKVLAVGNAKVGIVGSSEGTYHYAVGLGVDLPEGTPVTVTVTERNEK